MPAASNNQLTQAGLSRLPGALPGQALPGLMQGYRARQQQQQQQRADQSAAVTGGPNALGGAIGHTLQQQQRQQPTGTDTTDADLAQRQQEAEAAYQAQQPQAQPQAQSLAGGAMGAGGDAAGYLQGKMRQRPLVGAATGMGVGRITGEEPQYIPKAESQLPGRGTNAWLVGWNAGYFDKSAAQSMRAPIPNQAPWAPPQPPSHQAPELQGQQAPATPGQQATEAKAGMDKNKPKPAPAA